jgi:hypothetical protein
MVFRLPRVNEQSDYSLEKLADREVKLQLGEPEGDRVKQENSESHRYLPKIKSRMKIRAATAATTAATPGETWLTMSAITASKNDAIKLKGRTNPFMRPFFTGRVSR